MKNAAGWALLIAGGLIALGAVAGVAYIAFVFSVGTAVVSVKVDASVYHKASKAPVPNCLLAFERNESTGYGQTTARSDAEGQLHHEQSHTYGGSVLWPFARDRHPKLRFYLGEAPPYGSFVEVETWDIVFGFREPWSRPAEVAPKVELRRSLTHEDSPPGKKRRQAGSEPLETGPPESQVKAVVHVEPEVGGDRLYRIPIAVFLDAEQIAACQAETATDLADRASGLFEAGEYAKALEAYREWLRRVPEAGWALRGAGSCLSKLGRNKEAIGAYRASAELSPNDPEAQFWYANSLLSGRYEEAVVEFKKLSGLEPNDARGLIGLGSALYALDRCPEAIAAYEDAIRICADCLGQDHRAAYAECRRESRR